MSALVKTTLVTDNFSGIEGGPAPRRRLGRVTVKAPAAKVLGFLGCGVVCVVHRVPSRQIRDTERVAVGRHAPVRRNHDGGGGTILQLNVGVLIAITVAGMRRGYHMLGRQMGWFRMKRKRIGIVRVLAGIMGVHHRTILGPERAILGLQVVLIVAAEGIGSAADRMIVRGTGLVPRIIGRLVDIGFVEFLEERATRMRVVIVGRMIVVRPGRIYRDGMVIDADGGVEMLVGVVVEVVARGRRARCRRVGVGGVAVESERVHGEQRTGR